MKIAYTLTQCAHETPGGSAAAALSLWHALQRRPEQPRLDLVAVGAGGRPQPGFELPAPSVQFPWSYRLLYDLWNRTQRASVEKRVPGADIVHVTLAFGTPTRRARQICTVHDLFPFSHPEVLSRRGVSVMRAGMARVVERADLIMVPSSATAADVVDHGTPSERIRVVPWGATPETFTDDELTEVRQRYQLPENFVLFVGTVEPRKNVDVLLAAAERMPSNNVLALAGPIGWGDIADRVSSLARAGDDAGQSPVRVLGALPRRDLRGLMAAARALCMPSIREGFGLPALEAMAQGTPVIHSTCPALVEVIGDTGVSVETHDVDAWAEAMAGLAADRDLSVSLGGRAEQRAQRFTWEKSAETMSAVYRELA